MPERSDEFWRKLSYVEMSKNRRQVLKILGTSHRPLTPTELSDRMDIQFNSASRAVRQLASENLVRCVNPDAPRYRRYQMTEKGKEIVQELGSDQ